MSTMKAQIQQNPDKNLVFSRVASYEHACASPATLPHENQLKRRTQDLIQLIEATNGKTSKTTRV